MSYEIVFAVLHIIAVASYVLSLLYDQLYVDLPVTVARVETNNLLFKGRLVALTIWNMVSFQVAFIKLFSVFRLCNLGVCKSYYNVYITI